MPEPSALPGSPSPHSGPSLPRPGLPPPGTGLDPVDWPSARAQAHAMLDDILDCMEHVRDRPVWRPIPQEVRSRFREPSPDLPMDLGAVHAEFLRSILPYGLGHVRPGFMGFLLVRDGALQRETFATPAACLRQERDGMAGGSPWPCVEGPDLSRGFRALKTWFTLKVHGTRRLGAMIRHTCSLARHLADRVQASPELELLAPVTLNIVCFRHRGADPDALNHRIVGELQEAGLAAPSTTRIRGALAIRAAIVNHRTRAEDIDFLVEAVPALGRRRGMA